MEIVYIPPNCTSAHQPMHLVFLSALKRQNKYKILEKTLDLFESCDALRQVSKLMVQGTICPYVVHPLRVLDAVEVVNCVRGFLTPALVQRCWKKPAILPAPMNVEIESDFGKNDSGL